MDLGTWLAEQRGQMDRAEALWLERLAEFDRDGMWGLDGHLSCASWLVWKLGMARSTAFEKLRVAHELRRRPAVAEAFRRGDLSYSMARALTRMDRPDPAVDQALVEGVMTGRLGVADIEILARTYRLYGDQERPPADDSGRGRDVRIVRHDDGRAQVVVTLDVAEAEEFAAALDAYMDLHRLAGPVDESPAEDSPAGEAPLEQASAATSRAEAFMTLARTALAHAGGDQAAGHDRYLVHVVRRADSVSFLDGRPLHPATAALIGCDCATVAHTVGPGGEPLELGRKTREWSTAQRRAISVRDQGHCRFVGCQNRLCDIHHVRPWEDGGLTDVANGCCQCRRHHRMLHHGYRTEGSPDQEMRFYRPDGSYIGSTYPAPAGLLVGA